MIETGSRIRKRREGLAYSQQYVAQELGIFQPAYAKIEQGITKLDMLRFLLLTRILEVEPLELLRGQKTSEEIIAEPKDFIESLYKIYKENTQKLIDKLEKEVETLRIENKNLRKKLDR